MRNAASDLGEDEGQLGNSSAPSRVALTDIASNIAIQSREDNLASLKLIRLALPHNDILNRLGDGHALLPPRSILVLLPS